MFSWKMSKLVEAYCKECGKRFSRRKEAKMHAEKTGHRVVIKYR